MSDSFQKMCLDGDVSFTGINGNDNKHTKPQQDANEEENKDTASETSSIIKTTPNKLPPKISRPNARVRSQSHNLDVINLSEDDEPNVSDNYPSNLIRSANVLNFYNILLYYDSINRNICPLKTVSDSIKRCIGRRKYVHLIVAYYGRTSVVVLVGLYSNRNVRSLKFSIIVNGIYLQTKPIHLGTTLFVDDLCNVPGEYICEPSLREIKANVNKTGKCGLISLYKVLKDARVEEVNYQSQISYVPKKRKIWLYGPSISGKISSLTDKFPGIYHKQLNTSWDGYKDQDKIYVLLDQQYCAHTGSFLLKLADNDYMKDFRNLRTIIFISDFSIQDYFLGKDNSFMHLLFYSCEKLRIDCMENIGTVALAIINYDGFADKVRHYYM